MEPSVDSVPRAGLEHRLAGLVDRVNGWLLPPSCVLCGARGQAPCLDLCGDCQRTLPVADDPLWSAPGQPWTCFAPFEYDYPVAHLVHALKYGGQLAVGRVLGTLLAQHLAARRLHCNVDAVLPVPLHPARHASRGYNQSAEIARWVARRLGRPLELRLARRSRDTTPQVGLHLDRRRLNLEGAFTASRLCGRNIAIVDDVTTTGSTLRALSEALTAAGAMSVAAWCVCQTPRRHGLDLRSQPKDSPA
jgi:ComF family protein